MTVSELIKTLAHYPSDSRIETADGLNVFVDSYTSFDGDRVVIITDVEPPANVKAWANSR